MAACNSSVSACDVLAVEVEFVFLSAMGVGRGSRRACSLDFKIFSKKGCFLGFEWGKKQVSPLLAP